MVHSDKRWQMTSRWFIVRHGETDWNVEHRVQGHSDTPLNETGHLQAKQIGDRLSSVRFAAAYASDLPRVVETATTILRHHDTPLQTVTELREKHYGTWEGKTGAQIEAEDPESYARLFEDDITFSPPGGESDSALIDRVRPAVERLKQAHQTDENILIVSHGGTLRAILVLLLGLPKEVIWRFFLANGSLSVVNVYSQNSVLDFWNDTSHLGATHAE